MKRGTGWVCLLLILVQAGCSPQQVEGETEIASGEQPSAPSVQMTDTVFSPEGYVQEFYDWYLPLTQGLTAGASWGSVPVQRNALFEEGLARELILDAEAQAAADGEIVGLDFDPFLNSQDPCEHYRAASPTPTERGYRVNVHAVCSGTEDPEPTVVVELVEQNGSWAFTNFHYPREQTNLRAVLGILHRGAESLPSDTGETRSR